MDKISKIKLWWEGTGWTDALLLIAGIAACIWAWISGNAFWSHAGVGALVLFFNTNWMRFKAQLKEWKDELLNQEVSAKTVEAKKSE